MADDQLVVATAADMGGADTVGDGGVEAGEVDGEVVELQILEPGDERVSASPPISEKSWAMSTSPMLPLTTKVSLPGPPSKTSSVIAGMATSDACFWVLKLPPMMVSS